VHVHVGPRDGDDMEGRENMTRPMDGSDQEDRDDDDRRDMMDGERDRDRDGDGNRPMMRRPPMLCSELVCGPEDVEKCQELKPDNGRPQRALCIPLGKYIISCSKSGWNF
jgi:hypothetical protein